MEENLTLTKEELDERVAILRRFRKLLEEQRAKFQEYLDVLEKQECKISEEDADAILAHSELEGQIMKGITSIQKVIVPMEEMVKSTNAASYNPAQAIPVEKLQNDLKNLQIQVLAQNQKNRELLKSHIESIRKEISAFQNPYAGRRSVYAERGTKGSMIQIEV